MDQKLHHIIKKELKLGDKIEVQNPDMNNWSAMAHGIDGFTESVKIALIGKYNGLQDAYLSIIKSLKHATIACQKKLDLVWVDASQLESEESDEYESNWEKLKSADGVIVPGGFGTR
jgi:CTP synthase